MNGEQKVGEGAVVKQEQKAVIDASARRLASEEFFADLLDVSRRTFKDLRAAGLIPDPFELGPRMPRWSMPEDYEEALRRIPRRSLKTEPETLAVSRRQRIEDVQVPRASAGAPQ